MKLVDEDGFEYDEDLFGSVQTKREYERYIETIIKLLEDNMP